MRISEADEGATNILVPDCHPGFPSLDVKAKSSKERWAREHYSQIKISVPPATAVAFKAACSEAGVSMASEIKNFMEGRVKKLRSEAIDTATRRKRRHELADVLTRLNLILEAERQSLDNTPENLRNSTQYEVTEEIVEHLEEIIDLCDGVYE
jgi:hypothetical protein